MDCNKIKKNIKAYTEGTLHKDLLLEIDSHIGKCESCSRLYNNIKSTLDLLKPTEEIQEQKFYYTRLKQRMVNEIDNSENTIRLLSSRKILQPLLYAASIIMAVFIGIQIGSYTSSPEQYTDLTTEEDFIEAFSDSQLLNDFEQETIESTFIEENKE